MAVIDMRCQDAVCALGHGISALAEKDLIA